MALEAVCFQQELFGCTMKELYNMVGGAWGYDIADAAEKEQQQQQQIKGEAVAWDSSCEIGAGCSGGRGRGDGLMHAGNWDASCSSMVQGFDEWDMNSSSPETGIKEVGAGVGEQEGTGGRRKRRRTKSSKNKEEVENQRMTHIAVERNRRKQMNEYLAVLRSLMPASYVQRGDQASIIGGAINFVKELEQLVQSLEAQKRIKQHSDTAPFAGFFTFPQYSTSISPPTTQTSSDQGGNLADDAVSARQSAVADIEVTMVESHANLKIFSRKQPKQLIKLVVGLQNLWLTTLHLNVTTINEMVLYSFSLKVEDNCQLTTVDEIATAVHQMVVMIQEQAASLE